MLGIVAGTVIPDAGEVTIAGHDLRSAPLKARGALRYLPQEVELPRGMTGREILRFYADVFNATSDLDAAATRTGLGEALDHLASTYSVGMRRRLGFAATTIGDGSLYVLDEPFAGVDGEGRERMCGWLAQRLTAGCGLLLAAHDRDAPELERLSARAVNLAGSSST